MPKNSGKTVYFNRFTPLAKATSALTEATNPSAVNLSSTIVSATIAEYGSYVQLSSLYDMTTIDDRNMEALEVVAQNAGETLDQLVLNELDGGGTVQIANAVAAVSSIAATDIIDGADIRKAVATLDANKAKTFEDGYYKGIIPVDVVYDLRADSEWLDAFRYTDAANIRNGEVGTLHGVRFYKTNNQLIDADAGAGNVDVYSTFIVGKESYGALSLEGQPGSRIIVKKPSAGDTSNPLDMFSTLGWKAFFVAKVLNSSWVIQLKSASSIGSNA
jgi:N4-gp56 family major capsid protein